MDRGYIYVNKKSFINNLQYLSQVSKKTTCLVVKANAYGHGIKWSVSVMQERLVWNGLQLHQLTKEFK
ncbi:MAG: alanine racemase [Candidatus Actinomarina sp.]